MNQPISISIGRHNTDIIGDVLGVRVTGEKRHLLMSYEDGFLYSKCCPDPTATFDDGSDALFPIFIGNLKNITIQS